MNKTLWWKINVLQGLCKNRKSCTDFSNFRQKMLCLIYNETVVISLNSIIGYYLMAVQLYKEHLDLFR